MAANIYRGDVLAEETHSGRVWSGVLLAALIGPAVSVAFVPMAPARLALGAAGVIALGAIAMAWSGFQYRFLLHGVEIRTLGFRLRSIPKDAILGYSIEPWSILRGYGIRARPGIRAYVWGNKVVHIRTTSGDVFLGHSDPARIVSDLDRITGFVTPG